MVMALPLCGMSQKIKVDNNKIFVDGAEYATMEKDGCGAFSQTCIYTIKDKDGKVVLIIKRGTEKVASEISASNPNGDLIYLDFIFTKSKQKGQIARMRWKAEKVAEKIVKAGLFKDGYLDEEAANNFVMVNEPVYGLPNKEVIIHEIAPPQQGGNNINIHF